MAEMAARAGGPAWQDRPGPVDRAWIPLLYPAGDLSVRGIVLVQKLVGVWTHWVDRRTVPCLEWRDPETSEVSECPYDHRKYSRRWKGYLGIVQEGSWKRAIAEITAEGYRSCPLLRHFEGNLRGCNLRVYRVAAYKNAPTRVELGEPRAVKTLADPFSVEAVLSKLWQSRPAGDRGRDGDLPVNLRLHQVGEGEEV